MAGVNARIEIGLEKNTEVILKYLEKIELLLGKNAEVILDYLGEQANLVDELQEDLYTLEAAVNDLTRKVVALEQQISN